MKPFVVDVDSDTEGPPVEDDLHHEFNDIFDAEVNEQMEEVEQAYLMSRDPAVNISESETKKYLLETFDRRTLIETCTELLELRNDRIVEMPRRYAKSIEAVEKHRVRGKLHGVYALIDGSDLDELPSFGDFDKRTFYVGYGTLQRPVDHMIYALHFGEFKDIVDQLKLPVNKERFILEILKSGKPVFVVQLFESNNHQSAKFAEGCAIEAKGTVDTFNKIRGNMSSDAIGELSRMKEEDKLTYGIALLIRAFLNFRNAKRYYLKDIKLDQLPTFPPAWFQTIINNLSYEELSRIPHQKLSFLLASTSINEKYKKGKLFVKAVGISEMVAELVKKRNVGQWEKIKEAGINKTEKYKACRSISNAKYYYKTFDVRRPKKIIYNYNRRNDPKTAQLVKDIRNKSKRKRLQDPVKGDELRAKERERYSKKQLEKEASDKEFNKQRIERFRAWKAAQEDTDQKNAQ